MQTQDAVFKLCVFGDGGVGKTTLVNKYLTGIFRDSTGMTIGLDFFIKVIEINHIKVKLQIWDFAGEERFRFLLPSYIIGASGGIFMYDITRYSSLNSLSEWLEVLKNGMKGGEKQIPILLVGGKADLKEKRSVDIKEAFEMVKMFNLSGYVECSSKTGENVQNVFYSITRIMLEKEGLYKQNETIKQPKFFTQF